MTRQITEKRQISVRPSEKLLIDVETICVEYQLSNAEAVRQLLEAGLKVYKEGKLTIVPAKNRVSTRLTSLKISEKITGRVVNIGVLHDTPALGTFPVRNDIHE